MTRTVWAFAELEELDHQTGFVQIDDDLAEKLLKAGDVQDPYLTEPLHHVGSNPKRGRYATRHMKAGEGDPPPPPKRPEEGDDDGEEAPPRSPPPAPPGDAEGDDDKPKRGRPPKGK